MATTLTLKPIESRQERDTGRPRFQTLGHYTVEYTVDPDGDVKHIAKLWHDQQGELSAKEHGLITDILNALEERMSIGTLNDELAYANNKEGRDAR